MATITYCDVCGKRCYNLAPTEKDRALNSNDILYSNQFSIPVIKSFTGATAKPTIKYSIHVDKYITESQDICIECTLKALAYSLKRFVENFTIPATDIDKEK